MRKHWHTDWINLELWQPIGLTTNTRPFLTFSAIVHLSHVDWTRGTGCGIMGEGSTLYFSSLCFGVWGLGFGVSWVASIMCVVAIDVALGIVTTPSKTTAGDIPFCGSVSLFSCSRHTQPTVLLTSIIPSINFMYCLHFTHLPLLLFVYSCDYSIHACCLYCRCQRAHPITAKVSTKPAMHLRYEI